jgi:hypothetical protein
MGRKARRCAAQAQIAGCLGAIWLVAKKVRAKGRAVRGRRSDICLDCRLLGVLLGLDFILGSEPKSATPFPWLTAIESFGRAKDPGSLTPQVRFISAEAIERGSNQNRTGRSVGWPRLKRERTECARRSRSSRFEALSSATCSRGVSGE